MKKLICETCGEIPVASVNGYNFGDRLLEDVWFDIRIVDKKINVTVQMDAVDYFDTLNKKKWLAEAKRFVKNTDVLVCPTCKEYTAVIEDVDAKPAPVCKPIMIKTVRFQDLKF